MKQQLEKKCKDCLARGFWEGKHDCPPWLAMLVALQKEKLKKSPPVKKEI